MFDSNSDSKMIKLCLLQGKALSLVSYFKQFNLHNMVSKVINNHNTQKIEYPCLMKHSKTGLVVLMTMYEYGVVVGNPTENSPLGAQQFFFLQGHFSLTFDIVTLSN